MSHDDKASYFADIPGIYVHILSMVFDIVCPFSYWSLICSLFTHLPSLSHIFHLVNTFSLNQERHMSHCDIMSHITFDECVPKCTRVHIFVCTSGMLGVLRCPPHEAAGRRVHLLRCTWLEAGLPSEEYGISWSCGYALADEWIYCLYVYVSVYNGIWLKILNMSNWETNKKIMKPQTKIR